MPLLMYSLSKRKKRSTHWEKHTEEFDARAKRSMPDRVLRVGSVPQLKRCSSAGIVAGLSARQRPARIIATTAPIACSRAMSMTGDREIA